MRGCIIPRLILTKRMRQSRWSGSSGILRLWEREFRGYEGCSVASELHDLVSSRISFAAPHCTDVGLI